MLLETKLCAKAEYDNWLFQRRADLWQEFLRPAIAPREELGFAREPVPITYRARVVSVNAEEGIVTLDTREEIRSDLMVGRSTPSSSPFTVLIG